MKQAKLAVLLGGTSAEREVSLASGAAVCNALTAMGIAHLAFDPAERDIHALADEGITHAFIMLHGRGGEDGTIQGALEFMGIAYTGSGVLGSALCMDKVRTKQIWQAVGLPTATYFEFNQAIAVTDAQQVLAQLGSPVMVKPSHEGSSIGMAKVHDARALSEAVNTALTLDDSVLVEAFIQGDEYTVTILDGRALPSISMVTPRDFYDYEAKYQSNSTEYFCPSGLSESDEKQLGELAEQAFAAVSAEGWGRVDVMRNGTGQFLLLEVNTVPGMTEKSLVPKAAAQAGKSFSDLVMHIMMSAFGDETLNALKEHHENA